MTAADALNILPFAREAYGNPPGNLPSGWKLVSMIEPNAFGYIAHADSGDDAGLVVAFRGTETKPEWVKDFTAIPVTCKNPSGWGWVHAGFQCEYETLRSSILSAIATVPGAARLGILITGHSLGAALAVLCAADLSSNYPVRLCTFAGPRVGGMLFKERFDVKIPQCTRVVNKWDIVCRVPLPEEGFEHVGIALNIDSGFGFDESEQHSLDTYQAALERLAA